MSWKRERSNEMNLATSDDSGDNETEEFSGDYGCVQEGETETEIAIKTEPLTETETTAPSNAAAVAAAAASSLTTKGPAVTTGTTGSTNTTTETATKKKKTTTTTTSVGGNPGKAQQQAVSATAAATASSRSSSSSSSPNKKRPYIRTKRPVGYNDKSSITTATDTLWQSPLNVYDAVLSEASDLLQAATEAQQLGRLKMASAYLLLLHARLVGLGKRFDKAYSPLSTTSLSLSSSFTRAAASARHKSGSGGDGSSGSGGGAVPNAPHYGYATTTTTTTTTSSGWNGQALMAGGGGGGAPLATMDGGGQRHHDTKTAALASLLPSHIELDTAMMEHLARAAAELHAARCSGRYQQATATAAGLPLPSPMRDYPCAIGTNTATVPPSTHPTLPPPPPPHHQHHYAAASMEHYPHASPHKRPALHSPNAREFLQSTANHRGVTNAATVTGVATSTVHPPPPQPPQPHPSWPPQHHPTMDDQPRQTTAIGTGLQPRQQPTLQHTQVKAEMQDNDQARPSTTTTTSTPTTTDQASSQPNSDTSSTTPIVTTGMTWSGPRCKPVTAAMNTVPHAQCNVRDLLLLPRQRFSNNANDGTRTNTTAAPLLAPLPPPRDSAKPVPSPPQTVVRTL
jgi:hypothetical protein